MTWHPSANLVARLREVLARDRFEPHAQPVNAAADPTVVRCGGAPLVVVGALGPEIASGSAGGTLRVSFDQPSLDALMSAVMRRQGIWVGRPSLAAELAPSRRVDVDVSDLKLFDEYANLTVWPLYHNLEAPPADDPAAPSPFETTAFGAYRRVNEAFAFAASEAAAPCATVVVYGHELQLVPGLLKRLRPDVRIGIYLESWFPDSDVLSRLPHHHDILLGLLGADLIGVASEQAAANMTNATHGMLRRLRHEGWPSEGCGDGRVGIFPASVDTSHIEQLASDESIMSRAVEVRTRLGNPRFVMLGLDSTHEHRRVVPRLLAIRQLLVDRLVDARDVVVVQLALHTSNQADNEGINGTAARLGERINREFGRPIVTWWSRTSPTLPDRISLYLAADAFVATPMVEASNVWALEYVAARRDSGAIVLSSSSGAAELIQAATRVDPSDTGQMRDSLALVMHRRRDASMRDMYAAIACYDNHAWARSFLGALRWRESAYANTPDTRRWPDEENASGRSGGEPARFNRIV